MTDYLFNPGYSLNDTFRYLIATDIKWLDAEDNKNKPIYLLYSGGCDSTLVLDMLLEKERFVNTRALIHAQISNQKMKCEKTARDNYILARGRQRIAHADIPINDGELIYGGGATQSLLWLTQMIPFIQSDSVLVTGHHDGDSFFKFNVFIDWITAFSALCRLNNKVIYLLFPLIEWPKSDILQELKKRNIYDLSWWCETPTELGVCNKCTPCITHIGALAAVEAMNKSRIMTTDPPRIPFEG